MNIPLLLNLTRHELVDRYAGSSLGVGWTLLHPLANILIFTVIFSGLMGARLPGSDAIFSYSVYLVSGMIGWLAFANTVQRASNVLVERAGIITKVPVQLLHLPLYVVLSESVIYLISLALFSVFLLLSGQSFYPVLLLLPSVFLTQQLLAYALGLWFAMLNVFLRDVREFVTVLLQFWFWFTPIVYVDSILPSWVLPIMQWNPAYILVDAYHQLFLYGTVPDSGPLMRLVLLSLLLLTGAYLSFRALERDLRDFL